MFSLLCASCPGLREGWILGMRIMLQRRDGGLCRVALRSISRVPALLLSCLHISGHRVLIASRAMLRRVSPQCWVVRKQSGVHAGRALNGQGGRQGDVIQKVYESYYGSIQRLNAQEEEARYRTQARKQDEMNRKSCCCLAELGLEVSLRTRCGWRIAYCPRALA